MESDKTKRKPTLQIMQCKPVSIAPGTKSNSRLWRPGDPELSGLRAWLWTGAAAAVALVVGALIGRLLVP